MYSVTVDLRTRVSYERNISHASWKSVGGLKHIEFWRRCWLGECMVNDSRLDISGWRCSSIWIHSQTSPFQSDSSLRWIPFVYEDLLQSRTWLALHSGLMTSIRCRSAQLWLKQDFGHWDSPRKFLSRWTRVSTKVLFRSLAGMWPPSAHKGMVYRDREMRNNVTRILQNPSAITPLVYHVSCCLIWLWTTINTRASCLAICFRHCFSHHASLLHWPERTMMCLMLNSIDWCRSCATFYTYPGSV